MEKEIIHKVKRVGDNNAICGIPLTNTGIYSTQEGEFNCKNCKLLVNAVKDVKDVEERINKKSTSKVQER